MEFYDEKSVQFMKDYRKARRQAYRRRIFSWIGAMKKYYTNGVKSQKHPPLLALAAHPAAIGNDVSAIVFCTGEPAPSLSNFTGHKAMPERDDNKKGRIDLPSLSSGVIPADGYNLPPGGLNPGQERVTAVCEKISNPILNDEIGPKRKF